MLLPRTPRNVCLYFFILCFGIHKEWIWSVVYRVFSIAYEIERGRSMKIVQSWLTFNVWGLGSFLRTGPSQELGVNGTIMSEVGARFGLFYKLNGTERSQLDLSCQSDLLHLHAFVDRRVMINYYYDMMWSGFRQAVWRLVHTAKQYADRSLW